MIFVTQDCAQILFQEISGKTNSIELHKNVCIVVLLQSANIDINIKGEQSDSFTNYNYVGNTKVSVSIKKTYANNCTLSEIFLTEILKSFSVF